MKFVRQLAPPVAMVGRQLEPHLAAFRSTSPVLWQHYRVDRGSLLPIERPRSLVIDDIANRERRALAFEQYAASIVVAWRSAGVLMTFRPKFVGMIHPLLMLMREQRRFESETAAALAALSTILLHASTETQESAIELYRMFGDQLVELGRHRQEFQGARKAFDDGSFKIGDYVVAWRKAAQADLGGAQA